MTKGLGIMQKKVWINGNHLEISEINFNKQNVFFPVSSFLAQFLAPDPYYVAYTSGSTGEPKPIKLLKDYMLASARKTLDAMSLKPKDRILLALSTDHIGGIMMLVRWLEGDLDLYIAAPSKQPLADIDLDLDFTALVPYQLQHSLSDLHKVKKAIIGGGQVSQDLEETSMNRGCALFHTYGMTETLSHIALRPFGRHAYFKAFEDVRLKLDARDCLNVSVPYLGIDNLQTNDVVELKDAQQFKWLGRYDNVVNSGGIKLHPERLEQKIENLRYPFFLGGMPDESLGERLVLIVQNEAPLSVDAVDTLKRTLEERLGKYEKPKDFYRVTKLQYTPTEKLKRDLNLYSLHKIV
jgi:O-succinylbenzoic acid--CoA ligase